ncbi:MAG: hypothetical protein RL653_1614 [Pseudomonadota bacterium]
MPSPLRALPALLAALAACAPNPSPPVQVMALVEKGPNTYQPSQVQLEQVTDVVSLSGPLGKVLGNARLVLDGNDPLWVNASTDEGRAAAITKQAGSPVRASFIDKGGVLWPADFHSWNMVTAWFNLEHAYRYWQGVGVPGEEMQDLTLHYFPELTLPSSASATKPETDNALYFSPLQAFLVLPFDELQGVPLALNTGVMAHEYSHRVFNRRVFDGASIPAPLVTWPLGGASAGANLLKAADEGFADYHAYGASCIGPGGCNPNFLASSVPATFSEPRDFSRADRCLTSAQRESLEAMPFDSYNASGGTYVVGTVLAAALYQAGEKSGQRQEIQRALLAAYANGAPDKPGLKETIVSLANRGNLLRLETLAGVLASQVEDTQTKKLLCNELLGRLKLRLADVPQCPAASTPVPDCKDVP